MSQDILSDVLRSVRLRGALYFHVRGSRDWVAEAPAAREIAAAILPGSEHVMEYHVVLAGSCWAAIVGETPVRLEPGDVIVFPHGDPHVVSSAPGMRAPPDVAGFFERQGQRLPFSVHLDMSEVPVATESSGDLDTTLVCGFFGCDLRPYNPLIASLPRILHLRDSPGHEWTMQCMRQAAAESLADSPGGSAVIERLSEMLFIDVVRRHLCALPEESRGWLAGLRDRFVGQALRLMHEEPGHAWTVEELGRIVGLSRSALHERFADLIGQSPMQYLANWRMQAGAALLRDTTAKVISVAQSVGYDSEAAFARAFKRLVGMPPALWRQQSRRPVATSST